MWCMHREGALSVLKAFLLKWSCPVTVTTSRLKGPTALLWDPCGSESAGLGGSNFVQAEKVQKMSEFTGIDAIK